MKDLSNPQHRTVRAVAVMATAMGAVALGAFAIGFAVARLVRAHGED